MKFRAIISAFVLALALHASSITQKPLDEFLIYDIPVVFKSGTTTTWTPGSEVDISRRERDQKIGVWLLLDRDGFCIKPGDVGREHGTCYAATRGDTN